MIWLKASIGLWESWKGFIYVFEILFSVQKEEAPVFFGNLMEQVSQLAPSFFEGADVLLPERVDSGWFVAEEARFKEAVCRNEVLSRVYCAASRLGKTGDVPDEVRFWPGRSVAGLPSGLGDGEREALLSVVFPGEAGDLVRVASAVWVRDQVRMLSEVSDAQRMRLELGREVLQAFRVRDRMAAERLERFCVEKELTEARLSYMVGLVCLRRCDDTLDATARSFAGVLSRVPLSVWEGLVVETKGFSVRGGRGPVGQVAQAVPFGRLGALGGFACLMASGGGSRLCPKDLSVWDRLANSKYGNMCRVQGLRLASSLVAGAVARYGFLQGCLEVGSQMSSEFLYACQGQFGGAFLDRMAIMARDEDLGIGACGFGPCFFMSGIHASVWPVFSLSVMPLGMSSVPFDRGSPLVLKPSLPLVPPGGF